ncbi:MAG TPA: YbaK/EbsC family protein [Methylomirabilota bacterium]|jgi:prolyl-tRNA editing enzyme YbaK/EbsC (Cys-tRNA(Pro) deacylase)|nr:YbaK/EbsC family protein [Methylomirabilota bacterium]
MKPAAARFQVALDALGLRRSVIELPVEARTSQQAADAVGVGVGQIAKSLVFMVDGAPIMVIASGVNRVDERKLATLAGGKVRRADADTVKKATGYTIGGVPPFGHDTALRLWIDEDLLGHDLIYAAGGVPECIFPLTPEELLKATGGTVADVRESKSPKGERT